MAHHLPPSSSGLGHRPFTAKAGVQIPLGVPGFILDVPLDVGVFALSPAVTGDAQMKKNLPGHGGHVLGRFYQLLPLSFLSNRLQTHSNSAMARSSSAIRTLSDSINGRRWTFSYFSSLMRCWMMSTTLATNDDPSLFLINCRLNLTRQEPPLTQKKPFCTGFCAVGAGGGIRTPGLSITNRLLYP